MADAAAIDATSTSVAAQKGPRKVQVSNTKKSLYFFVGRAKNVLQEEGEVSLSALGQAISTMVSVVEILKKEGLAFEKSLSTSTEHMVDTEVGRDSHKVKMEVIMAKTPDFDRLLAEQQEDRGERAAAEAAA